MDFVTEFLSAGATVATNFGTVLVNATQAITDIVWIANEGGTGGQLSIVGAVLALALGVGAVYLIFRMVRGLVKQNERG